MIITNETDRELAVKAIEAYDRRKLEFVVGESYNWKPGLAWQNQGKRHGPMKCVHVGVYQGLFTSVTEEVGAFENASGLHIVATQHLKSGDFIKVS